MSNKRFLLISGVTTILIALLITGVLILTKDESIQDSTISFENAPPTTEELIDEQEEDDSETCDKSLETLQSTNNGGVVLVHGPLPCQDAEEGIECAIYKAVISPTNTPGYPIEDPDLDEQAYSKDVILAVRTPNNEALCSNRWIVFDAGGYGNGYAVTFGDTTPGGYSEGGDYGDDLIKSYNDLGYVTVDLVYQCEKENCDDFEYKDWLDEYRAGTAWYENLNGSSHLGAASRTNSVIEWAHANSGHTVCAHAQSSGSGRVAGAMTRLNAEEHLDTVVFDGGPAFSYFPWICGIDDGPLGPAPTGAPGPMSQVNRGPRAAPTSTDCTLTEGDNTRRCTVSYCADREYHEDLLKGSMWYSASQLDFPDLDISIVLGGEDTSNAVGSAFYWLSGYAYQNETVGTLSANTLSLVQGGCASSSGTYSDISCADWNVSSFPGVTSTGSTYDTRLANAPHNTTEIEGGMEVVQEQLLATCEVNPN
jgi:hypothetical protein